jgi:hypothetical protein
LAFGFWKPKTKILFFWLPKSKSQKNTYLGAFWLISQSQKARISPNKEDIAMCPCVATGLSIDFS